MPIRPPRGGEGRTTLRPHRVPVVLSASGRMRPPWVVTIRFRDRGGNADGPAAGGPSQDAPMGPALSGAGAKPEA